ncbi:hypothetical protein BH11ACT7_BH11ACT7_36080 [soil metagenome]
MATTWRTERARLGLQTRNHAPAEEINETRRRMRALQLEEHVLKVLGETSLSDEQRERIASLLRAGGGAR